MPEGLDLAPAVKGKEAAPAPPAPSSIVAAVSTKLRHSGPLIQKLGLPKSRPYSQPEGSQSCFDCVYQLPQPRILDGNLRPSTQASS